MTLALDQGAAVDGRAGRTDYETETSERHGSVTPTGVDPYGEAVTLGEFIESGRCVKGGRITLAAGPGGVLGFACTGYQRDGSEQWVKASLRKVR